MVDDITALASDIRKLHAVADSREDPAEAAALVTLMAHLHDLFDERTAALKTSSLLPAG